MYERLWQNIIRTNFSINASLESNVHCTYIMYMFIVYNWRAGASQPSRTTSTIFLYIYHRMYVGVFVRHTVIFLKLMFLREAKCT